MATETLRTIGRSIRDVTTVTTEDLRRERFEPGPVEKRETAPLACRAKSRVICIASGKGGTGKTVVTTNLSILLSRAGLKVLIFDADLGLANAHLLLGVSPKHDISEVIGGRQRLSDIIVECEANLRLIPGGSGFSELADLNYTEVCRLMDELRVCEDASDIVLVDLSAGISPQVMRFLNASHDVIIVTTPDVTAMLDAYATIKALSERGRGAGAKIIVNQARDRNEAAATFKKIASVAAKHLGGAGLSFFGWIPENWYIEDSVFKRHPVVLLHPKSFAVSCLKTIAEKIKADNAEWARQRDAGSGPVSFSSSLRRSVF